MILPILTAGTVRLCVKGLIGMREWRLRGLADEMQNSSIAEMHDFMTRVGYNGRIVIDGGRDGTERRDRSRDERPVAPAQSEQPPAKLAERRRGVGARPTAATERRDEKAATRREQQTAKSTEERRDRSRDARQVAREDDRVTRENASLGPWSTMQTPMRGR